MRTVIRMVREALLNPGSAVDIYLLAFQAGVAMEVLAEMAATPLFYHRCPRFGADPRGIKTNLRFVHVVNMFRG